MNRGGPGLGDIGPSQGDYFQSVKGGGHGDYRTMRAEVRYEAFETEDAALVVVAYGSIGRIAKSAVRSLRAAGLPVGLLRPITLYPFPEDALRALAGKGKRFLTIEHNLGQMVEDVRLAVRGLSDSDFFGFYPGNLPTPDACAAGSSSICGNS